MLPSAAAGAVGSASSTASSSQHGECLGSEPAVPVVEPADAVLHGECLGSEPAVLVVEPADAEVRDGCGREKVTRARDTRVAIGTLPVATGMDSRTGCLHGALHEPALEL